MNKLKLLIAMVAGMTFSMSVSAAMYKWVDDQGTTHYGETIPPEYANKSRQILNKSGAVIRTQEVLTPDQQRAKEAESAKMNADEAVARDQKRYDKSLTDSYSSVNEIELARSRSLQQVDARINSISSQLKMANNSLIDLQNEIADRRKAGKKVPAFMLNEIKSAQSRVQDLQQDLDKSRADKLSVDARFNAEKARYKELTGK